MQTLFDKEMEETAISRIQRFAKLTKAMELVGVDKAKVTANHYNLASAFELCDGIVAMLMPICIDKAKVNTKVKAEIKLEDQILINKKTKSYEKDNV